MYTYKHTHCKSAGVAKARMGWLRLLTLTIIAGCYVGIGFSLCLIVGGNIGL